MLYPGYLLATLEWHTATYAYTYTYTYVYMYIYMCMNPEHNASRFSVEPETLDATHKTD